MQYELASEQTPQRANALVKQAPKRDDVYLTRTHIARFDCNLTRSTSVINKLTIDAKIPPSRKKNNTALCVCTIFSAFATRGALRGPRMLSSLLSMQLMYSLRTRHLPQEDMALTYWM
eukprot:5889946-Amphidinium_carterae.1